MFFSFQLKKNPQGQNKTKMNRKLDQAELDDGATQKRPKLDSVDDELAEVAEEIGETEPEPSEASSKNEENCGIREFVNSKIVRFGGVLKLR